jgi:alpha-galactosidase
MQARCKCPLIKSERLTLLFVNDMKIERRDRHHCATSGVAVALLLLTSLVAAYVSAQQSDTSSKDQLTGNWVVRAPNADGTSRLTYFNLKQEGSRITGSIRVTQFYYLITESTGGAEGFKITGTMKDGKSERRVQYEGKLVGDELHIATRRRPDAPLTEMLAHRAPADEGALPARIAPPALHKVPDNGLARTPPMGWNSWNKFAGRVDDASVRSIADAMATNGMKAAGYLYINIDDTWEGGRDAQGNILTNKKFPDMKALADYVHSKGLKLGIYSSPGPNTCAGYEGSYGHEEQDARTYAAWGIDYLKYDWCGARTLYTDEEMPAIYQKMGDALRATKRPIVYSLCQYGRQDVWKWGADTGGNLWRTTGDIRDAWDSMSKIGFNQNDLAPYARPGHWNDPDMLEIGNGGMTETEYRTHMSLWAMLTAPLLAGNDLRNMSPEILAILTNREVIAVDQDKDGKQATRVWKSGDQEVWARSLRGGAKAIAFFNRAAEEAKVSLRWADLGISGKVRLRDLWLHRDVEWPGDIYSVTIPGHGVVMLRAGR